MPTLQGDRTKIGYDLFSNIPNNIQNAIENQSIANIETKLNTIDNLSGSLLAITDEELYLSTISPLRSFNNSAIWHGSVPNQIPTTTNSISVDNSPFKLGLSENSTLDNTTTHFSPTKTSQTSIHVSHNATSQIGINERASFHVDGTEVGIANDGIADITSMHKNSSQVGTSQVDSNHTNVLKVSSPQIDIPQNDSFKIDSRVMSGSAVGVDKLDSSEVTLPVVIPNQQFFRSDFPSHNLTSKLVNNINNTATKIWSDLLQSQTQLDIDFQITDLPTGQLAKASITGFDENGIPNAGTILIDHDANGIGWFIDETPLDNSEFTAQNTDSFLLAAAESEV